MTQRDHLNCVHEPFGDAFYFGPERLSERYDDNEPERLKSGFSQSTYQTVLEEIEGEAEEVGIILSPRVGVRWVINITHRTNSGSPLSFIASAYPSRISSLLSLVLVRFVARVASMNILSSLLVISISLIY